MKHDAGIERKMHLVKTLSYSVLFVAVLVTFMDTVHSQSMDPRVNITETDPPSDGYRVFGEIADDVLLNCYVENLPEELQVRWQLTTYDEDGRGTITEISTDMSVTDNNKWSIEKPTSYSWRLRVKALSVHDEGNYTCYVRLTGNNDRAESNRTVFSYATPLILESESSSDMQVKEGDGVTLRCNATGRPQPTIMWRRQGNAIMPGGGVRYLGGEYKIDSIPYDARGLYICEAFNDMGTGRRDITLSIQHAPKITADDEEVYQAIGYQRTMICYIEANPSPSLDDQYNEVFWSMGSQPVQSSDRWETNAMLGAYGQITYELTIYQVQSEDYGIYQCHSSTNLGTGTPAAIELIETDEPQPDKRGEISSANQTRLSQTVFIFIISVIAMFRIMH